LAAIKSKFVLEYLLDETCDTDHSNNNVASPIETIDSQPQL